MVEFVSYSGKYPNLCSGTLVLKVNGKIYRFGHGEANECLLMSGGSICFSDLNEFYTEHGPWVILCDRLPAELIPYASEISRCVNENIRHGCCGGCI